MQQYMKHQLHGRMPVYNHAEIEANRKNGWELETGIQAESKPPVKAEVVAKTFEATEEANDPSPELISKYEEKFGKKPHHRMKPESIEAALAE